MTSKSLVFEFSARAVRTSYACVLALDFVLLWAFFALISRNQLSWLQQILRRQVDFTIESVAAVWYSGIILLLTGIAAVLCFSVDSRNVSSQKSQSILRYGWIPVAFAFAFFSLDEMGSIHERLDKILPAIILSFTGGKTGWVTVLWPLMTVVFGYFVCFFWFYLSKYRPSQILALIGAMLLISVPVQEKWHHFSHAAGAKKQAYLSVLEEGSELIGTTLILIAFLEFALFLSHMQHKSAESEPLRSEQPTVRIVFGPQSIRCFYVLLPLLALLSFLTALFFVPGLEDLRYRGDPSAWYPSAALFLAAVFGFLLMARHSVKGVSRLVWTVLGITALWFSVDSQASFADLSVKYLEKTDWLSGFMSRESRGTWLAVTLANGSLFATVWRVNPRSTRLGHGLLIAAALASGGLFLSQSPLIARESLRVLAPTGLVIFLTEVLRAPRQRP